MFNKTNEFIISMVYIVYYCIINLNVEISTDALYCNDKYMYEANVII